MKTSVMGVVGGVAVLLSSVAGCKSTAPPVEPTSVAPAQPSPPVTQGAPVAESPDVAITAPTFVDLTSLAFKPGPDALPPGAQLAVIEGTPPFSDEKSFTIALKFPKGYTIPPHQHIVTERVTVVQGTFRIGHGPKMDPATTKAISPGGLVLLPANHTHYAMTTDETVVMLQGVGPWGIYYINPKDDPRPTPAEKPQGFVSRFDAPVRATALNPTEVAFTPAPTGMLPRGAQMAVLEGDPAKNQNFVLRIKVPDGYRFPLHSHSVTDRLVVISGSLMFGTDPTTMKEMKPGALSIAPAGQKHLVQARGETVFQVSGTGPFDIRWTNPDEDPARSAPQATAPR